MDLINFFKTMKCEDVSEEVLIFRSSRFNILFSILLSIAGSLIIIKSTAYFMKGGFIIISFLGIFIGSLLCLFSIVLFSINKKIVVDIKNKKVRYYGKCSFLTTREVVFHFNEILQIEVYPCKEVFFTWGVEIWKIKLYLKRGNKYCALCVFENQNLINVLENAEILQKIINVPIVKPDLSSLSCYKL